MFSQFNFEGHTLTGEDFVRAAERASERKLARKKASWALLNVVGVFSPIVRELVKMNYLWFTPHSLSGQSSKPFSAPSQPRLPTRRLLRRWPTTVS